ncbi:MAG: hypothetical protein HOI23_10825 [Deltaproteobacteria bacterium]|nr:hypothetical protein [Deltaproteobacteria bacterium]MBT6492172.1 hypothetical protein [Deltaproteobacteria bacterium]
MQTSQMERVDCYIQILREHRPKKFSVALLHQYMPPGLSCSERTIQRDLKKLIQGEMAKELQLRWGKGPYWIALPKHQPSLTKISA